MPDPGEDSDNPNNPYPLFLSPYTYAEEERLEALSKPRPQRWGAYLLWLADAMPSSTGGILMMAIILGVVGLLSAGIVGILLLLIHGGLWFLCLISGVVLGLVGRVVLRDAAATELGYRQRIADKQQRQREREER